MIAACSEKASSFQLWVPAALGWKPEAGSWKLEAF
jgi:hypothetical protein